MFQFFPLLLLVVIAYNIVALVGAPLFGTNLQLDTGEMVFSTQALMEEKLFSLPMLSKSEWVLTYGDIFVVVALILLFIELIRSTSIGNSAITNHALSLGVLVICIVEFVVVKGFATSTFFFFSVMALIDVVAGFIISIRAARRDFGVGEQILGGGR